MEDAFDAQPSFGSSIPSDSPSLIPTTGSDTTVSQETNGGRPLVASGQAKKTEDAETDDPGATDEKPSNESKSKKEHRCVNSLRLRIPPMSQKLVRVHSTPSIVNPWSRGTLATPVPGNCSQQEIYRSASVQGNRYPRLCPGKSRAI